uniref:Centromere protein J C-terminal domain-containing protein n=1 Tax=Nannospalax galili TaxID=1026970 RepID=A0A8C6QLX3_NANGA
GLQQQICDLATELTRQASWWCAAHKDLQNQIDALTRQNQELREDLRALKQGVEGAKTLRPSPATAEASVTLPPFIRTESVNSEKITAWDQREDTPSGSLQNESTAVTGRLSTDEKEMSPSFKILCKVSDRKSPEPTTDTTFQETESYLSPCWSWSGSNKRGERHHKPGSQAPVRWPLQFCWWPQRAVSILFQQNLARSGTSREDETDTKTKDETQEKQHPSGKVEQVLRDGWTITTLPNGTGKEVNADKKTTLIKFFNGDMKKVKPDQRVVALRFAQTTHTTYTDGVEIVQFPNKWTEVFYPDGSKETVFPDGTIKQLKDGCEETVFPDRTTVTVKRNGDKTIMFSNGKRKIHTAKFKRREFPDGTTKTETKYASGRVRVKDETGTIILDWK